MCAVVTRDVEDRYRGFLGSAMLELAPGMYVHPRMSAGVRDRLWTVLSRWHGELTHGSIVMTWAEMASAGALGLRTLGEPAKAIIVHEGVLLVRRPLRGALTGRESQDSSSLTSE